MPSNFCRLYQKCKVNYVSLYDSMNLGTLCSRTISLTYILESLSIESVLAIGKKWVLFVNLSTTTHMEFFPIDVLGKLTTTSMDISSHFHSKIGNNGKSLVGL